MGEAMAAPVQERRRELYAWAVFDWATSPFAALIVTFVIATYFAKAVAPSAVEGQALWGWAMSVSVLASAVIGTLLGAIADAGGPRKPWLLLTVLIQAAGTAAIWWVHPSTASIMLALVTVGIANFGSELGNIFYNAILGDIAPRDRIGSWSGFGWGLGYVGGLICLTLALVLFLQPEIPAFGLDKATAANVRIIGPLVALWLLVFSLPIFLIVQDRPGPIVPDRRIVREGMRRLRGSLKDLFRDRQLGLFMLAAMLWADGLTTIFAIGGIIAAGVFRMELNEILMFGILMNITSGIGAWFFARSDDRRGSKATLLVCLAGLILAGTFVTIAPDKLWFSIAGGVLGLFIGPVQSATRTALIRIAPADRRAELFGILALTGRATSFLGPMLVAIVTTASGSQRIGMTPILALWAAGALVLLFVPLSGGSGARRS